MPAVQLYWVCDGQASREEWVLSWSWCFLILVTPAQTSSGQGQLKNCMKFLSLLIYVKEDRKQKPSTHKRKQLLHFNPEHLCCLLCLFQKPCLLNQRPTIVQDDLQYYWPHFKSAMHRPAISNNLHISSPSSSSPDALKSFSFPQVGDFFHF